MGVYTLLLFRHRYEHRDHIPGGREEVWGGKWVSICFPMSSSERAECEKKKKKNVFLLGQKTSESS